MAAPRVDVIVLNWNGGQDTLDCLASLAKVDYDNMRVVVVDNGSTDSSVQAVRARHPEVAIVQNAENLGFAEGNNRGIAQSLRSNAQYALLLNNDTEVGPRILQALVKAAEAMPGAGIFGPKIYFHAEPDTIWYAGGYWDKGSLTFNERGAGLKDEGQFAQLEETEWVIGCAMFIRADVFRRIGLLEPSFFLNNEEIDFCSRARRAGIRCAYVPDAVVWHKVSRSFGGDRSPMKEYFSARNRLLWAARNASLKLRLRIHAKTLRVLAERFTAPIGRAVATNPGSPRAWWWIARETFRDPRNRAYLLGIRDFFFRRFGNCPDIVRQLTKEWVQRRTVRTG